MASFKVTQNMSSACCLLIPEIMPDYKSHKDHLWLLDFLRWHYGLKCAFTDSILLTNCDLNSSLIIPFARSKFSEKLGNENVSNTFPPLRGILAFAISRTDDPPLGPGEVAMSSMGTLPNALRPGNARNPIEYIFKCCRISPIILGERYDQEIAAINLLSKVKC